MGAFVEMSDLGQFVDSAGRPLGGAAGAGAPIGAVLGLITRPPGPCKPGEIYSPLRCPRCGGNCYDPVTKSNYHVTDSGLTTEPGVARPSGVRGSSVGVSPTTLLVGGAVAVGILGLVVWAARS